MLMMLMMLIFLDDKRLKYNTFVTYIHTHTYSEAQTLWILGNFDIIRFDGMAVYTACHAFYFIIERDFILNWNIVCIQKIPIPTDMLKFIPFSIRTCGFEFYWLTWILSLSLSPFHLLTRTHDTHTYKLSSVQFIRKSVHAMNKKLRNIAINSKYNTVCCTDMWTKIVYIHEFAEVLLLDIGNGRKLKKKIYRVCVCYLDRGSNVKSTHSYARTPRGQEKDDGIRSNVGA